MKKIRQGLLQICLVAFLCVPGKVLYASDFDDRIESSIKNSYVFKRYLKDENIHIQSKSGAVTLTGKVSEEYQKLLANDMVLNLPGVKSLDNFLGTKGELPVVHSDAWIITQINATLLFHRNVNGIGTQVLSENGAVTLRGKASSTAQKDLTTEYAMDVEGVLNVINEIIVEPIEMKPDKLTTARKADTVIESMDDASITALVKTTLLYHRSTNALNIIVSTNAGMVKLEGIVNNAAEKDLAGKLANDVHGVKSISNDMTIN
ncbi:MAG: BON domain-containing protein [Proteobacteria bacterium]|nr:BON domain-containing protein [Desulfobacula sp.]MBU3954440.1 BON domain-containing protein [Pseudomonadota bacterium]MBU4133405.1 BON domain-containing protein [Pseudomonadota bacterium]